MTDDLLRRAAQALRDESSEADSAARFTRARVMSGLQRTTQRRRLKLAFALPLAACFAAATAFGTIGRPGAVYQHVAELLGLSKSEPPKPTPAKRVTTKTVVTASPMVPAPTAAIENPTLEVPPAPAPAPSAEAAPLPATSSVTAKSSLISRPRSSAQPDATPPIAEESPSAALASPPSPPPAPPAADPGQELYRVAHQAHFVDHDFGAALRAWDAYLGAAPAGRFAPEARYNRALCLVRLGRKGEAESALRPFADGAYGGYRRDEAKALIEALGE